MYYVFFSKYVIITYHCTTGFGLVALKFVRDAQINLYLSKAKVALP